MRIAFRFLLFLVLLVTGLQAQTTRDYAVDLKADVSTTVPRITLSWSLRQAANISGQQVFRRLKGESSWGTAIATLGVADTSWADSTALEAVEYEYWLKRTYSANSPSNPQGYTCAGVNVPVVEDRGKMLLVVDETMLVPLGPEIEQLKRDLTADGWTVQTISAARRNSLSDTTAVADTKALIKAAYDADPANVKMVYVLGHVPVPYSGSQAPDGHGNHSGAWSADGFYGDMNGAWTDTSINNTSSTEARIHNIPGDGKLDQNVIPSALELMVGRVDLASMQRAPASTVSEATLLRRYLRKAHDFKTKQGAYSSIQRRVLIRDGFGYFSGENFMMTGWSWAFTGVGRPPEVTIDEAPSGNWWTHAAANTYLLANGNGGGSYETCSSVGATADFGRRPFRAAFVSLFGSYFGDWDVANNFMKAPLAGNATGDGLGLCCFWAGRPAWFMHHMGMGEPLGYSIRLSMSSQFVSSPGYTPYDFPIGGTHCGLMGDPSLRMHVVESPRNLAGTSANSAVTLAWSPSSETNLLGYHVYRAANSEGPFVRLTTTPVGSAAYTDVTGIPGTGYTYMVRTLKLESSPGGSYHNLSLGEMTLVTVNAAASGVPLNASGLTVAQSSSVNATLNWQDNATDETGYRVERKVGPAGTFAPLVTLGSGSTMHTDAGAFANNEVYYYRVVALNGAGDAAPSNEASFEAVPGYFEFDDTLTKVSKTIGTAVIPVKRFGGINGPVTVNYATANSSAIAGTHFTTSSGTLSWADGETGTKNISVPIINTASAQQARQFRITLSVPSAGTGIGTYNAIAVLIEDPTATLSSPWNQAVIGTLTSTGLAVQAEGGISSTTVGGAGLVTAATSESGQFVYQTRTGDGVMTAFVPAPSPAQSGARYALMVRENATAGGSLMAGTAVSTAAGTFAARQVYRITASGTATFSASVGAIAAPCWLRITRAGNSFNSEASTDGITWVNQGTTTVAMSSAAQWGFFHTSDDRSGTTYSGNFQTASVQNLSFSAVSAPGAPGSLAAGSIGSNSVTLTWTAGTSAAGYRLERRTETSAFKQIIDLPASSLNFTDTTVSDDTAYEYRIYAYNSSGNSPLSNVIGITTLAPGQVVSLTTEFGPESYDASIKGGSTGSNFGSEPTLRVGGSSSSGSIATNSKTYLRFNLSGQTVTPLSASLRLTVAQTGNLANSGFTFTGSLRLLPDVSDAWTEAGITWDNAPHNNTTGSGFQAGTTGLGSFSITDPLSVPSLGTVIALPVSASVLMSNKGANGVVTLALNTTTSAAWIDFASKEHATLPPPTLELTFSPVLPTRPSFLTVIEGTGANLDLNWVDNSTGETGFEIERRPAGGTFALLTTTAANATAFSDTTTTLGTTFEYRVRAVSTAGNSAWSLVVAATAGGSTNPLPGARMTFAGWMAATNLNATDESVAGADADGDGIPNLVEYALGSPANFSDAASRPSVGHVVQGEDQFLTLTFARRLDATDVQLMVEVANDPSGPWAKIDPLQPENQVSARSNEPQGGWQTLTVKDNQPMSVFSRRFIRLSVSR